MEKATPKSNPKHSDAYDEPSTPGKLESMLYRFACGKKFHRFSAERVGDHCLPTTISDLQISRGLYFTRKFIKVPNRFGSQTSVMLYWLEGDNLIKARQLIGLEDASVTNHQDGGIFLHKKSKGPMLGKARAFKSQTQDKMEFKNEKSYQTTSPI